MMWSHTAHCPWLDNRVVDCVIHAVPEKLAGTVKQRELVKEEQVRGQTELFRSVSVTTCLCIITHTHTQTLRTPPSLTLSIYNSSAVVFLNTLISERKSRQNHSQLTYCQLVMLKATKTVF